MNEIKYKVTESTYNFKTGEMTAKELSGKELEDWIKENDPRYYIEYQKK